MHEYAEISTLSCPSRLCATALIAISSPKRACMILVKALHAFYSKGSYGRRQVTGEFDELSLVCFWMPACGIHNVIVYECVTIPRHKECQNTETEEGIVTSISERRLDKVSLITVHFPMLSSELSCFISQYIDKAQQHMSVRYVCR